MGRSFFFFLAVWISLLIPIPSTEGRSRDDDSGGQLLACLGQEEGRIHQGKITGPVYELNQLFVNELAMIKIPLVRSKYIKQICSAQDFSPAVTFLKLLLIKGMDIFELPKKLQERDRYFYHSFIIFITMTL